MLKVVIIGYGEMFTNLIAATLDANCEIVGVLRKDTIKYPPFYKKLKDIFNPSVEYSYIKSYNLPEIEAKGVNTEDFRKKLLKLNPDIILVGSWGEKFEKATYNIPKIASINAHPSLLPKYRGPNPYFWTIKNQENVSGITFHLIDDNYDNGAILAQEEIKIYPSDTGKTLKQRTVLTARGVACELLNALKEDIIIPLRQKQENATYFSYPAELELNFKKSAEENFAAIRAIHPWNSAYFYHNITPIAPDPYSTSIEDNKTNYTTAGTVVDVDVKTKTIAVLCQDRKVLRMSNVSLYKKIDRYFTKNYIAREIKPGSIIV
ncbi:hypothetical protein IJ384_07320 [bacterium]|nr:hypothetical protein [bacterium]